MEKPELRLANPASPGGLLMKAEKLDVGRPIVKAYHIGVRSWSTHTSEYPPMPSYAKTVTVFHQVLPGAVVGV